MDDFLRLVTLRDANTRTVLVGAMVLGVAAAVVGALAVLRRRSLVGDAVAHAALPGVCLAYLVIGDRQFPALLAGAAIAGVAAAAFVALVPSLTRVKEDAAIGLAIGGFFGVGVVLLGVVQNLPGGNRAGLDGFVFGKAASMVSRDAAFILAVAAVVIAVVVLFYKELRLVCFDRQFAAGHGWPTFALDLLLMGLVCVCTVVGLPAVGVVLMVALLVIPGVSARFWTDRLGTLLVLAAVFGGASGLLGTALSATAPVPAASVSRGWPTGPLIVLVAAAIFAVSILAAPRRGLIADGVRRLRLRRRVAMQNLLRDVFEALEPGRDAAAAWTPAVARSGAFPPALLARAIRQGLVAPAGDGFMLTAWGRASAARVVRAHRLWERYLIEQADIAADHVDRDADQIEHVLPPLVIAQLEAGLVEQGRLPSELFPADVPAGVPESPHPISAPPARGTHPRDPAAGVLLLAGAVAIALAATPARAQAAATLLHVGSYGVRADDLWTIATAVACSVSCGVLGCFLVLRRQSLLGDAISHAILPGLALAFLLSGSRSPGAMLSGALVVGVATALVSGGLTRWGRVPADASMGVVFTTLFALGVILVSLTARQVDLDPSCVLYGLIEFAPLDTVTFAGVTLPRSLAWLGGVLIVNTALIALFYKELKAACFDPALATTMGFSAAGIHAALMALVAGTAVASFEAVGSILVIAMLVAPGATAQLLTDRLPRMLALSAVLAALSAVAGYAVSVWLNVSVAGSIASVSLAVFVLVMVGAPRHGALARRVRARRVAGASVPPA